MKRRSPAWTHSFLLLVCTSLLPGTSGSLEGQNRTTLVPLVTWFSASRGDYFTTSDPAWRMEVGAVRRGQGDYRAVRWEGFVYSPDRPQPPGTVPLYHWWSASRQDNFLTTDPAWAGNVGETRPGQGGYRLFRIEGYVLESPRPGFVPLRQYWEGSSQDNWTTSEASVRAASGFREYRIAGYLRAADGESVATDLSSPSTTSEASASETPRWADARLQSLRFIFRTGRDDKRGGSYVSPYLILQDGSRLERRRLDCFANAAGGWTCYNFTGGSERAFVWDVEERPRVGDLARLGIQFASSRPNVFDTPDNWDLRSLEVVATARMSDGTAQTRVLFSGSGQPLHRFPGSSSWETGDLRRD